MDKYVFFKSGVADLDFLIGAAIILIFLLAGALSAQQKKKKARKALERRFSSGDFTVSERVDGLSGVFCADGGRRLWFIRMSRLDAAPVVFPFEALVSFDVYDDGNRVAGGRRGRPFQGGVRAVDPEVSPLCSLLEVRARVRELSLPELVVRFIDSPLRRSGSEYAARAADCERLCGALYYIQNGSRP